MEDILADIDTSALIGKIVFLAIVIGIALLVQRIVVHGLKRALDAAGVPKASIFVNIVRTIIWVFALLAVLEPVFGVQPTAPWSSPLACRTRCQTSSPAWGS